MPVLILILSLLLPHFLFASDWKSDARILIKHSKDIEKAKSDLKSKQDLNQILDKALDGSKEEEKLSLGVIRELPQVSMVKVLLERFKKMDVHSKSAENYVVTLTSLIDSDLGTQILDELSKKINLTDLKTSTFLRVSFLRALSQKKRVPDVETLTKLLEDNSFEIRLLALDVAEPLIEKSPEKYIGFLHKALESRPVPLRINTLDIIQDLKPELRKSFKFTIESCARSDSNQEVREACSRFKF